MPAKYKLTYFPVTALGEPIRFLLAYGNLEFDDVRFDRADWPEIKKTTPFGQVPMLEFDGNKLAQSGAICRYLARELNLVGKTNLDAAKAEIIVDTISDFRGPLAAYHYDSNPETKAPKLAPLQNETVPFYLSRFDKIVADNGGYFVNGQLTWADLYFVAISDYLQLMAGNMDFFSSNPNLKALKEKVVAIPQIKAWIDKRPASD